jgi:hypothetical protein
MNKAATRVRGPWSNKDPPKQKTSDVIYLEQHGLEPWMKDTMADVENLPDARRIDWYADDGGDSKKNAFLQWATYNEHVQPLPYVDGGYKDFMQFANNFTGKRAYAVNVVRSISWASPPEKKEFNGFIGAIESLKDGYTFDGRYQGRQDFFSRPHVIVFANQLPLFDEVSRDKWCIYRIVNKQRVDVTAQVMRDHALRKAECKLKRDQQRLMADTAHRKRHEAFLKKYKDDITVVEETKQQSERYKSAMRVTLDDFTRPKYRPIATEEPLSAPSGLSAASSNATDEPPAFPGSSSNVTFVFDESMPEVEPTSVTTIRDGVVSYHSVEFDSEGLDLVSRIEAAECDEETRDMLFEAAATDKPTAGQVALMQQWLS